MRKSLLFSRLLLCATAMLFLSCEKQDDQALTSPGSTENSVPAEYKSSSCRYTFWANETIDAGVVNVRKKFGIVTVEIILNDNWTLSKSYIHAEYDWLDIPLDSAGNPIVWQFDYIMLHDPYVDQYTLTLNEDFYGAFYIAVHGNLVSRICSQDAWAEGFPFPGDSWAMYALFNPGHFWMNN
jgi:hypothetical protein